MAGVRGDRVKPRQLDDIVVSDPDYLVFPRGRFRKQEIIDFYVEHGDVVLPHVIGRPLTLVRRKGAITRDDALRSQSVFVRHAPRDQKWAAPWLPRMQIAETKKVGEYLYVDSLRALLALINADVIEWHVWNAKVDDVEHPDRVVFDIDPGDGVTWPTLVAAAKRVRDAMRAIDLESWVKTTGGKGLHVVVPFRPEHSWELVFEFSRLAAEAISRAEPEVYTLSFDRDQRAGRILIDYKRNYRTSIAVAGYSMRARPHGTLSVPLRWSELREDAEPIEWRLSAVRDRLARLKTDPWKGYWTSRQRLPL